MKILIIRFSSIGDIVLTTPAIRCVRQQVPGAEVHFLSKKVFKAVTEHNPYIDRRWYYDKNLDELIVQLKKERYDVVIDLQKNVRSHKIRLALRAKVLSFKKLRLEKFFLTKLNMDIMPGHHITSRCLDAVRPLGVRDDGNGLDYFIAEEEKVKDADLPLSHRSGFIALVIGASYYTKKLPVSKLQELCGEIGFPIVLVGGKEDREEGDAVAATDPLKIYNACGQFGLNGSADLIRRSRLVISHDTGMQYIACAFHKRVLAVWGGTSPALDVEPYYGTHFSATQEGPSYRNFVVPGLRCQPCSSFGKKKCPRGHFKCMQLQDIRTIGDLAGKWADPEGRGPYAGPGSL